MLLQFFLRYPIPAILLHVALGYLMKMEPQVLPVYYVGYTALALLEVLATRDRANLAAYHGLYIVGMEILNRMSRTPVFWEFGKYACIGLFGAAIFWGPEPKKRPYLLLLYFILLLPGLLVAAVYGGLAESRLLDLVSQYLSGPLALLVAGWYFYRRSFQVQEIGYILRAGIFPSISVVTLLFLGKSLSEIDFVTGSNFDASGGFGPNQVSSALGWGIVLIITGLLYKVTVTGYRWLDLSVLALLVFRGLLTFSRGGMMAAFGAIAISMVALVILSARYRRSMKSILPKIAIAGILLLLVAIVANDLTGNFLLYRYQGKSTSEVILGKSLLEKEYFSGREDILEGELRVFVENPLLGIGVGRGTVYREGDFRTEAIASHTEFTRMLGEHGIPGLIAMFCGFVLLPFRHFRSLRDDLSRQWMLLFFSLAMLTLLHSGMRLAFICVAFGMAFMRITRNEKP